MDGGAGAAELETIVPASCEDATGVGLPECVADDAFGLVAANSSSCQQRPPFSSSSRFRGLAALAALGALLALASRRGKLSALAPLANDVLTQGQELLVSEAEYIFPCVGELSIIGLGGKVSILQAGANTPWAPSTAKVWVRDSTILHVPLTGRAYFADACPDAGSTTYSPSLYVNTVFLNKVFSFTVDVSQAGCGCVAALYLVGMHRNDSPGSCGNDYYCDASNVCGVMCSEYDIMEANKYVFRTTAHNEKDTGSVSAGLGTWIKGLDRADYGPGSPCIDTNFPFTVEVYFPLDDTIVVSMWQAGKPCGRVFGVKFPGLDQDLAQGMTPVFSYWSSNETAWLDGPEWHEKDPVCPALRPEDWQAAQCGQMAYLSEFRLGPMPETRPTIPDLEASS